MHCHVMKPRATICHVISTSSMPHHGTTTLCPCHVFNVIKLPCVWHACAMSTPSHPCQVINLPHQCSMLTSYPNYLKMCECAHPKISTPQIPALFNYMLHLLAKWSFNHDFEHLYDCMCQSISQRLGFWGGESCLHCLPFPSPFFLQTKGHKGA